MHEILVGNVGLVYQGGIWGTALAVFNEYKKQSKSKLERASGENVTWIFKGEVRREWIGRLAKKDA